MNIQFCGPLGSKPFFSSQASGGNDNGSGSSALRANLLVVLFLWPVFALFNQKFNKAALVMGVLCVLVSLAMALSPNETVQVEVTYPDGFEFTSITIRGVSGSVSIMGQSTPLKTRKLKVDMCSGEPPRSGHFL